jgi:hypothetical protein
MMGVLHVLFTAVLSDTFNNIAVISWRSVLLVVETGVPGENHRSAGSHWQTLSHNVVSSTPHLSGIQTTNFSDVLLKKKFQKFQYKSDQVKNWHFKSWCRCVWLFFIGFHLFYLLIRISINLFTTFFHNIIVTSTLKMQFSYCMNLLICFS